MVLVFSDPMVDVLAEIGNQSGIPSFYISFVWILGHQTLKVNEITSNSFRDQRTFRLRSWHPWRPTPPSSWPRDPLSS